MELYSSQGKLTLGQLIAFRILSGYVTSPLMISVCGKISKKQHYPWKDYQTLPIIRRNRNSGQIPPISNKGQYLEC